MPDMNPTPLVQSLAEALETMGFIMPFPADGPPDAPPEPRRVTIEYSCGNGGRIELLAPLSLGRQLAANMLGSDPADERVGEAAEDALRELLNVTCGSLLRRLATPCGQSAAMGLPAVGQIASSDEWNSFVGSAGTEVLDADGAPIAVRLRAA
jgi:chemotaxis protein CheY-P-specific phosphatase CheC